MIYHRFDRAFSTRGSSVRATCQPASDHKSVIIVASLQFTSIPSSFEKANVPRSLIHSFVFLSLFSSIGNNELCWMKFQGTMNRWIGFSPSFIYLRSEIKYLSSIDEAKVEMRSFDREANLVSRVECERTESPKRNFFPLSLSLSVPGTFANCDTDEERRHRSPPPPLSVRTLTFNISKTIRSFRNGIPWRGIDSKLR